MTTTASASSSTRWGRLLTCPPRWGTPRTPSRPTLGPKIAEIAKALGKPLLPHQRYIVDVALEIDPRTGLPAYGEVVIVGPRQGTGKTETLLPVMTHRCLGFGPMQRVLYTAQTADSARAKWRDIHLERLRKSPLSALVEARLRLNAEALIFPNGSMWSPGATTGRTAGTGDTLDLPVLDEGWAHRSARAELGLRPAMMTRANSQLWIASMVPGLTRVLPHEWPYLRSKMVAGRSRVEAGITSGMCYVEFSADDGLDPASPSTWWSCIPGLGYTVTEKKVREDFEAFDLVDFCAEYLGWEPTVKARQWQVIRRTVWDSLWDSGSSALDPVALCVDTNLERSLTTIGMAGRREDGDWHVEVVDQRPGVDWSVERVVDLCRRWSVCVVAVDANGPAASLVTGQAPLTTALAREGITVEVWRPNLREVSGACAGFFDATGMEPSEPAEGEVQERSSRRVHHIGQAELTGSVASARMRMIGSQWVFDRAVADCPPVYTVSLALAAGERVDWLGGDYDVADSLG